MSKSEIYLEINRWELIISYLLIFIFIRVSHVIYSILLNKFRGISLYVANDVIAKLYGTKSLVKERAMVDNLVTYSTVELYALCNSITMVKLSSSVWT